MLRRLLLAAITVVAIASAMACDDDSPSGGGTSTTAPPPTAVSAAPPAGDDAGFRAFAKDMDAAVKNHNDPFFRQRLKTVHVDCSTAADANQAGGPVCETPNAAFDGFGSGAWRSEAAIVPVDAVITQFLRVFDAQLPGEQDSYGAGAAQVYALNVKPGAYKAAITALVPRPPDVTGSGPLRAVLSTSWVFDAGEWRMESPLITAYVLAEDFLKPTSESGYDAWERFKRE